MKQIFYLTAVVFVFTQQLKAQHLTAAQVEQLVNNKHFIFEAQTMNTQRGSFRQFTTEYFLKAAGDSLVSALPYFGRAYTVPINPDDAGYNFTSTAFDYSFTTKKNNRYIVSIKTKNRTSNTDFELTIYSNGSAYLNVNNPDRQPISFNGYIK